MWSKPKSLWLGHGPAHGCCNCHQRLTCWLDELAHRMDLYWPWLCDRHEYNITGIKP